jgi:hypothetical protein
MTFKAEVVIAAKDEASAVLRAIGGEVRSISGVFGAIGGAIGGLGLGALAAFTANAISSAAALDDLSEVTGASVEELSKLEQVAVVSGVAIEDVAAASVKLTKALGEAEDPASGTAKALAAIGLTAKDLKGLDPAQQMQRLAQALGGFADGTGKTNVALALLGKTGAQNLPFLKDLAEAGELNATITAEQAAAAEQYEKASKKLNLELNKLGKQVAAESIPVLTALKKAAADGALAIFGIGQSASTVDRSNAIRDFAQKTGLALAYIGDAADGVVRGFQIVGETIAATAAAIGSGDWDTAKSIFRDLRTQVDAIVARDRFSTYFKRSFAEISAAARSAGDSVRNGLDFAGPRDGGGKSRKEEIDDARNALAKYVDQLEREADKLGEITEQERIAQLLRANPSIDTPQVRELLAGAAERVARAREEKALREEETRLAREAINTEKALRQEVLQLAGAGDEQRKIALTEQLDLLARMGLVTEEQALRAVKGIAGIRDEVEKTKDMAEELGLVFASSLGRFLDDPSGGARGFFKALAQDVQKLITQLLIVKPLTEEIRNLFSSEGGSGGNWFGDLLRGAGSVPLGFGSSGAVSGVGLFPPMPDDSAGWGRGLTIVNHIDGAIDRARVASYVETGVKAGLAQSWDNVARGGSGTLN